MRRNGLWKEVLSVTLAVTMIFSLPSQAVFAENDSTGTVPFGNMESFGIDDTETAETEGTETGATDGEVAVEETENSDTEVIETEALDTEVLETEVTEVIDTEVIEADETEDVTEN